MLAGSRLIGGQSAPNTDLKIDPGLRRASGKEIVMQRYPVRKKWMLRPVARCSGGC